MQSVKRFLEQKRKNKAGFGWERIDLLNDREAISEVPYVRLYPCVGSYDPGVG